MVEAYIIRLSKRGLGFLDRERSERKESQENMW